MLVSDLLAILRAVNVLAVAAAADLVANKTENGTVKNSFNAENR